MEKSITLGKTMINHVFIIQEKLSFFLADNVGKMSITLAALLVAIVKKDAERESIWPISDIY